MHEAKGAHSPMSTTKKHSFCSDSLSIDATLYHQILGVLQYLLMTCLDISFAINHLSQFMHCLKLIHWVVIKRVILYASSTISLHVFSYSDWVDYINGNTSISTYVVFLGANLVS